MDITQIGTTYGQNAIKLIGIIIFILVLMYVLKRLRQTKFADSPEIRVINTVAIGTKERIILMEANNTMLLIGATPNHISTLHVFDDSAPEQGIKNEFESLREFLSENNSPLS